MRSGIGPLFLHYLSLKSGKLVVPGILKREYTEQAIDLVQMNTREIKGRYRRIHAIVGEAEEIQFPTDSEVKAAVEARLVELASVIFEMPTTDEIILAAASRSFDGTAPALKSDHGLKDCVIWETILRLPTNSEVHLVSKDGAFFGEKDELAPALRDDAERRKLKVTPHRELGDVLTILQDGVPPLDIQKVTLALHDALRERRDAVMKQWSLTRVGPEAAIELKPYFTRQHNVISVEFSQTYAAVHDLIGELPNYGLRLVFSGSFSWLPDSGQLRDLRVDSETLINPDGVTLNRNATVYIGGATLTFGGRQKSPYRDRWPMLGDPLQADPEDSPGVGRDRGRKSKN
jgi:hypothetical protein